MQSGSVLVMAITASEARIGLDSIYARSDFLHLIRLCFSKEGMDHIAQNQPGSDTDGLAGVWLN